MEDFPHHYVVNASLLEGEHVAVKATDLPEIISDAPVQFGGPGGRWSPEELLMGAIADSFVLGFRAIAKASELDWVNIDCSADGTLDHVDKVTRFTAVTITARLTVGADTDRAEAERLLHESGKVSLAINSMAAETHLDTEILVAE